MPDPLILVDRHEAVAVLRLNRPTQLNVLTADLTVQLREAVEGLAADAGVRAIVLTGEGRAFCAGQDLADSFVSPEKGKAKDLGHIIDHYHIPLCLALRDCAVPTVCAVNGVAAGAGVSLALGCDIVMPATPRSSCWASTRSDWCPTAVPPGCCRAWSAGPTRWNWPGWATNSPPPTPNSAD